jgi:hypothetical protein
VDLKSIGVVNLMSRNPHDPFIDRIITFLLLVFALLLWQSAKEMRDAARSFLDQCGSLHERVQNVEHVNAAQDQDLRSILPSNDLP